MRTMVAIFLLLVMSPRLHGQTSFSLVKNDQVNPSQPVMMLYKIPGQNMKKAGNTLTGIGSALLLGGIAVYSIADKTSTYNAYTNTYYYNDLKVIVGPIMMVYGVGMLIPGIILSIKGTKKMMRYYERQQNLSFHFEGTSVGLHYTLGR